MITANRVLVFLAMAGTCISFSCTMGGQPGNYTATMVVAGMEMQMAKMGDRMRTENPVMKHVVTLALMDQKKTISFSTKNQKYFEEPMKQDTPSIYGPDVQIDKKKVGTEEIGGHPCVIYDAVIYAKDKPDEKYDAKLWEAKDLGGLVIRSEMRMNGSGAMVTELRNIQLGAAKKDMFVVPEGYQPATSMAEVMGMPDPSNLEEGMKQLKNMFKNMGGD